MHATILWMLVYTHKYMLEREDKQSLLCVLSFVIPPFDWLFDCLSGVLCVKFNARLLWDQTQEQVIHIYLAQAFIFHRFIFLYPLYILFFIKGRKFLVMLLFSSQLVFDCCATLKNINCEPQYALIAGIEMISCIPKSANFALKMIRLLIIRASCSVVDTFDWGSN